jgi:hypothetical protein
MRPQTRGALDRLLWRQRLLVAVIVALVALGGAVAAVVYAYVYRPDPVVEARIVSGVVTGSVRQEGRFTETWVVLISVTLDDGRKIAITQPPPPVLLYGPAEIEERRHRSGRVSFRWLKPKLDGKK